MLNNNISHFDIGCEISSSPGGTVEINNNKFTDALDIATPHDFMQTAITIQNPGEHPVSLMIQNDTIINARIGIHARLFTSPVIGASASNANPGNYIKFNQSSYNYDHAAIWLEACDTANIQQNTILKTNSTTPAGGVHVWGIKYDQSTNGYIEQNTITDLNNPVNIYDVCNGTEFHCNIIDNGSLANGDGIYCDNATIDNQGFDDPFDLIDQTWDNQWYGYDNSIGQPYGVNGSASPFNWYFDPSFGPYFPNANPGVANNISLLPTNSDQCTLHFRSGEEEKSTYGGNDNKPILIHLNSANRNATMTYNDSIIAEIISHSVLTHSDSVVLNSIAIQEPSTGGKAVYQARAILFREIYFTSNIIVKQGSFKKEIAKEELSLFPNPSAKNDIFIDYRIKKDALLTINDLTGKCIQSFRLFATQNLLLLNAGNLRAGIYAVVLITPDSILTKKLVIGR